MYQFKLSQFYQIWLSLFNYKYNTLKSLRFGYFKAIFCVFHFVLPYSTKWDDQTNWNFFLQKFEALVVENTNTFVLFCTRLLRLLLKTYLNTFSLSLSLPVMPIKNCLFSSWEKTFLSFSTKIIFIKLPIKPRQIWLQIFN